MIRQLRTDEKKQALDLSAYAFQFSLSESEEQEILGDMDERHVRVRENDEGDIAAKLSILPLRASVAGVDMAMGGIAGVATWPEYRRGGHVSALLVDAFDEMRQAGQTISFLYPFSIPFYRKFGYELFASELHVKMTREQFPLAAESAATLVRIEPDKSYEALCGLYHDWAKAFTGTLKRDKDWWDKRLLKRKKGSIIATKQDGRLTGYMIYSVKDRTMTVKEMVSTDTDSRLALFTFIRNHDSMADNCVITVPPDSHLPYLLPDPKIMQDVKSYFMMRIVDVEGFFAHFSFQTAEKAVTIPLHITDDHCPWNNGTFLLAVKNGDVSVSKIPEKPGSRCAHPPKKGIHLSINSLAAIMAGVMSTSFLNTEGIVTGDESSILAFDALIPVQRPFIYDFF